MAGWFEDYGEHGKQMSDVEGFRLSAVAEQETPLGTVTATPEPMEFNSHRDALVALSEWIFDGCMPLGGNVTRITATITKEPAQ